MFCPTCGGRLAQALSYCNHCGATLKVHDEVGTPGASIDTLVWVIVGTTITLLGMALGALVLMKDGAIHAGLGTAFVILSFAGLVVVEGVLVWRFMHLNRSAKGTGAVAQPKDFNTSGLNQPPARELHEPACAMPSVTEQTTHTFEPSNREDESC